MAAHFVNERICQALQQSFISLVMISSSMYLRIGIHKVPGQRYGILFCSASVAALLGNVVDLGAQMPH